MTDHGGRTTEDWPTEHTEHTEGFLTGGNGENGGGLAVTYRIDPRELELRFI